MFYSLIKSIQPATTYTISDIPSINWKVNQHINRLLTNGLPVHEARPQ